MQGIANHKTVDLINGTPASYFRKNRFHAGSGDYPDSSPSLYANIGNRPTRKQATTTSICLNSLLTHIVIRSHLTYANSKAGPTRLHKLKALQSWLRWFHDNGTADKLLNATSNNTHTQAPAIKRKIFPYSESSEVPGQR